MPADIIHEIERRFLVERIPPRHLRLRPVKVDQGYLAFNEVREVRIRKKNRCHYLTVKVGEGLIREEVEFRISRLQFSRLWPLTEGRRIDKQRYSISYRGHTIELDVFHGSLEGLCIAEVEFPDRESALRFKPPSWFGREITDLHEYKNVNLALQGMPDVQDYGYCVGALPYRRGKRGMEIVVITNRSGSRWIVPKGQPEADMSRHGVAEMEAVEEAGVLGTFTHGIRAQCSLHNGKKLYLYPLAVSTVLKKWPESSFRKRKILPVAAALDLMSDKGLRECVRRLATRLG